MMAPAHPVAKLHVRVAGHALARYMRLVWRSSRAERFPDRDADYLDAHAPAIIAMWHGQFMLIPIAKPPAYRARIIVARHGDAEVLAAALAEFDLELIRGAGAAGRKKDRGGREALRGALRALDEGHNVAMTADVPPGPARVAGEGIVTLARLSGRPILPVAVASSRYHAFATWSRLTINLPSSRIGFVVGDPVWVARDASPEQQEAARKAVEATLNAATERAYGMAGVSAERATPFARRSEPVAPGFRIGLYRGAASAVAPFAPLLLRRRARHGKEDPARLDERKGIACLPRPEGSLLWLHAASVGETNAILPLIASLKRRRPDLSLLLTTVTVTSARIAADRLPEGVIHQFMPLDAPPFVTRFLDHWRPDVAVLTESEIWPNLILAAHERSIPLLLANARISDRSYYRWKRSTRTAAAMFGRFAVILAQSEELRRRFVALGGRNVITAGNLKVDAPPPPVDDAKLAALVHVIGARPHLLAASTHQGEEAAVIEAHIRLSASHAGLLTTIAPRHPERGPAIEEIARAHGLRTARRAADRLPDADTEIYIADTMGELGTLYRAAPVAFVGGTLAPKGGQNPIEAIHHSAAVIAGPSRENFADTYSALDRCGGLSTVTSVETLVAAVDRLFADRPALERQRRAARSALAGLTGALDRTIRTLEPFLPEPPKDSSRAT